MPIHSLGIEAFIGLDQILSVAVRRGAPPLCIPLHSDRKRLLYKWLCLDATT